MAQTQLDIRQSVYRSALNMAGTTANAGMDSITSANDALLTKLFQDRNISLGDGGTITFTGTSVSFSEPLLLNIAQYTNAVPPLYVNLGSTTQSFTNDGDSYYATIVRSVLQTTGTYSSNNQLTNVPTVAGLSNGMTINSIYVPPGTTITNITGSGPYTITMSNNATGSNTVVQTIFTSGSLTYAPYNGSYPVSSGSNQEIFMIMKRLDSADGTQMLYFRNGSSFTAGTSARLGSSGSGSSGSGTGDDLDSLQYQTDLNESFAFSPTTSSTQSSVDTTQSNATYSPTNKYMTLSYDASKTVTGTGTSMTMSGAPAFTVAVGDILRVGTQARKITGVTSQTAYTIEAAFSTNPSTSACCVSQAVYSKDANNYAFNGVTIASQYTGSISDCLVAYNDTSSGTNYNYTDPSLIGYTASADGSNYTTVQSREANLSVTLGTTSLPTTGTNMYVRFFSNASSGSGTVNLTNYKVCFHRLTLTESGGIQLQAYCFSNSVGTPVGCSNPTVNSNGVSQVVLSNAYPVGVNSGNANGGLRVYLNGQKIPRFINSTLTPDASYTEVNATTIALDKNYSSYNYSIEVYQEIAVVDSNTQNTTSISILQTVPTIQIFNQSNYYTFTISAPSSAVSVGAVYTNNSSSFTVVYAVTTVGTTLVVYRSSGTNAPTSSGTLTYSSGTGPSTITFSAVAANGTYQLPTSPNKPRFLRIKMVGGGGGGGGAATSAANNGNPGGNGGTTTFGTSLLTCNGGSGGTGGTAGGGGGVATVSSPAIGLVTAQGASGVGGPFGQTNPIGGPGGSSILFGAPGQNGGGGGTGSNAIGAGSGGQGGCGATGGATAIGAGGGGAGAYIEAYIPAPSSTYTFSIGAGGTLGSPGTSGFAGGTGAPGAIIVEEWY